MSSFWRVLLTMALCLPLWLVTSVAHAERAPQCDKRGATSFAPPPQLQEVLLSLDSGAPALGCPQDELGQAIAPGGKAPPMLPDVFDGVLVPVLPELLAAPMREPCSGVALPPRYVVTEGVRRQVARPPRS